MQGKLLNLKKSSSLCRSFLPRKALFSFSNVQQPPKMDSKPSTPPTFYEKWFGPGTSIASPLFTNRWLVALPCFLNHLCIGSPYAWSMVGGLYFPKNF